MILETMLLEPQWPAPAHVRAAFTTRAGGVSVAPFDTLNLGDHVNDNANHVAQNRARLQAAVNARAVFLKQVHGVDVARLHAATADGLQVAAALRQHFYHDLRRAIDCQAYVFDLRRR